MPFVPWAAEDDTHIGYSAYDGPPNPAFDPADPFPEPDELEWPYVLVRCSMSGTCERAARVDAPVQSIDMPNAYPGRHPSNPAAPGHRA